MTSHTSIAVPLGAGCSSPRGGRDIKWSYVCTSWPELREDCGDSGLGVNDERVVSASRGAAEAMIQIDWRDDRML